MLVYRCPTTSKIVQSGIDASEADMRRLSALRLVSVLSGWARDLGQGYAGRYGHRALGGLVTKPNHAGRSSPLQLV